MALKDFGVGSDPGLKQVIKYIGFHVDVQAGRVSFEYGVFSVTTQGTEMMLRSFSVPKRGAKLAAILSSAAATAVNTIAQNDLNTVVDFDQAEKQLNDANL